MTRERLPDRRANVSVGIHTQGAAGRATWGFYADGRPAELFLDVGKPGSGMAEAARDAALVLSIALQHGVPLAEIAAALSRDPSGAAAGPVGVAVDALAALEAEGEAALAATRRAAAGFPLSVPRTEG